LGNFPQGWSEWNDKFRNNIRAFWRGDAGAMGEFIRRFCGSSDIYQHRRRAPSASVNYICSHDGFTLNDLVSYQHKHNEANLENNRDGDNNNLSWNCGVEGSTDNPRILALREQYKRNLIASLMLSKGVVQLLAGDEFGNSQQGNNNSYCQDNEIGWLDWQWLNPEQFAEHAGQDLFRFCQKLIQLRKRYQTFWQDNFFQDKEHKEPDSRYSQVHWFNHRGQPMQPEDWNSPATKTLCVQLKRWRTETEARQFILLFNLSASIVDFVLPALDADHGRYLLFDTAIEGGLMSRECDRKNQPYPAIEHSLVLFVDRLIDKKQGF
jgi:glycogen operon protein